MMYALWHLCAHAYMTTCSHVSAAVHVQQHGRCARQQPYFQVPVNEHFCRKMMAWCKNVDVVLQVGGMELQRVVGLTSSSTGGCKWDIGQSLRVLEQSWA